MVDQILISTMYLHFSNFFLVFMIVRLVGEAVVIVQDFRPLIPALFLSPDNTFERFQARAMAQGLSQAPAFAFEDTFASVIRYESLRLLIAICARNKWPPR